ncbi:DUF4407 domain-containing protein [Zobellia galactanivorans]|uniref:Conserved hypothetical membrane protein n=1 Tax=Zobellia galactanivorans (strain DSM 12802 / CCUG 47099 / CIP 106680 / NCIMB 13871 / Dsij) TaxID=63186 RepID=G0LCB2_ZOBGA|nr:DUF4407 domain-containing protein [Zobellia galactanivorans]CAZ96796.1 Conserved hypothetical membrane protein [Zobellia galactanivorans]
MERDFYKSPKPSKIMRFFWKAAGGDSYILERSTYSDQVKYMCLGGIIVATGLMAALAGGYAFYTIFEPRGSAIEADTVSWTTSLLSIIFGVFWGLMIFNLDRFIVSSTGTGDGTEAITWGELKGAIPRLLMGAIIALTISKPVEIRMFKSEIDAELHSAQMQKQQEYIASIDSLYAGRIQNEKEKISKWENEIQTKEERYVELENQLTKEMSGDAGPRGYGPEAKKIEQQMKRLDSEINIIKNKNTPLIEKSYQNIVKFEKNKQKDIDNAEVVASGLDGLLERIKLAHKIAGFWISLFITLLFLAIELTPIFFKLMLIKSPYDFLKQNTQELIIAEQGIYIQYNYHKDKNGQERDLIKHLESEKLLLEKKELLKAQEELTQYAISKYKEDMMKKIDDNPESFIKSES